MIELAELRVFIAAAEERNFSRAGARLHLSQSAVSQNIQCLEKAFGVELFNRRGRSVWLSEAGQALLPLARDVLNSSRLLEEAMNTVQSHIVGELVIGCSTTSGKYLIPCFLGNFREEYPNVKVKVSILSRDEVVQRLIDERLTLGMVSKHVEHPYIDQQPLFEDRMVLVVPADHPWGKYGKALPADLPDQPLIVREPEAGSTEVLMEGLAQHGIHRDMLNIVMEIGSSEGIEMAVEEGLGIAFISELSAARGLATGRLKKVEVEGVELRRTIYIARNTQKPLTRPQDRFWSFALNHRDSVSDQVWKRSIQHLAPKPVFGD